MEEVLKNYVNGQWVESKEGETSAVEFFTEKHTTLIRWYDDENNVVSPLWKE